MTNEELDAIEQHALNVDSRLAEGCLRVITCLKASRAARAGEQRFLQEAQEAAETYWEAWQDAVVYWKAERDDLRGQVARLEAHVEQLTGLLDSGFVSEEYWGRAAFDDILHDRDSLRTALEKYGRHEDGCPLSDSIARLRDTDPCICGLAEALKGAEETED